MIELCAEVEDMGKVKNREEEVKRGMEKRWEGLVVAWVSLHWRISVSYNYSLRVRLFPIEGRGE